MKDEKNKEEKQCDEKAPATVRARDSRPRREEEEGDRMVNDDEFKITKEKARGIENKGNAVSLFFTSEHVLFLFFYF